MKPCNTFIQDDRTTSATKCRNCACEKWEHNVKGKGLVEYLKSASATAQRQPVPLTEEILKKELEKLFTPKRAKGLMLPPMGEEMHRLFNEALKEEIKKDIFTWIPLDEAKLLDDFYNHNLYNDDNTGKK